MLNYPNERLWNRNVLTRLKRVAGKQTTTLTGWGASRGCNKNCSCGKVRQPRKPGLRLIRFYCVVFASDILRIRYFFVWPFFPSHKNNSSRLPLTRPGI
jgi:hypothetical protein